MADSDCSNCKYSRYNDGPCQYYEYECVFCPFFGVYCEAYDFYDDMPLIELEGYL